jgi:hypothetical protein
MATDGDGPSTSYRLLAVRLVGPGGGAGAATTRYLYLKPHASEADGLPKERALFVAGVPAALAGPPLVELFARFGEVERAALHASRTSAVLLFAGREGRDRALKAAAKGAPLELHLPEPTGPCGLKGWYGRGGAVAGRLAAGAASLCVVAPGRPAPTQRKPLTAPSLPPSPPPAAWVEGHKALKPGNGELQAALDEWMEEWEAAEAAAREAAEAAQQDDGWTVVQRHKVGLGRRWEWRRVLGGPSAVLR